MCIAVSAPHFISGASDNNNNNIYIDQQQSSDRKKKRDLHLKKHFRTGFSFRDPISRNTGQNKRSAECERKRNHIQIYKYFQVINLVQKFNWIKNSVNEQKERNEAKRTLRNNSAYGDFFLARFVHSSGAKKNIYQPQQAINDHEIKIFCMLLNAFIDSRFLSGIASSEQTKQTIHSTVRN